MNKIILTGNTTKDLETRTTESNKEVSKGTIAVSRSFKNKNNEYETDFFNFVVWTPNEYVKGIKKGTKILLEGEVRNRTYENEKKEKRQITEIFANHIEILKKQEDKEPEIVNEFSTMNTKSEYEETPEVKLQDEDLPF